MTRPVLVAAGGTGGHIFPALAVARELNRRNIDVVWVGTQAGLEARLVPAAGFDIRWITVSGLRGKGFLSTLVAPLKLLRACWQSVQLIKQIQPRAILGMGGFVTGPVGLASFVLRKPLVLHEQNAVAGMTNRWLSRVADCVLSAMPGAFSSRVVTRVVGNPLRKEIEEHAEQMRRNVPQKPTSSSLNVLIIGGSQGARVLNQRVPQAIAQCSFDINVIHQTGVQDEERVRNDYQALCTEGASITSSAFIEDMLQAYRWCDLVICRAGAMTVAELAGAGVPSILVPFPFAVDDHQTKNAQHLTNAGAAILMPELKFTSDALTHELDRLHNDRAALADMAAAARQCYQANATQHVADALTEFCK